MHISSANTLRDIQGIMKSVGFRKSGQIKQKHLKPKLQHYCEGTISYPGLYLKCALQYFLAYSVQVPNLFGYSASICMKSCVCVV